MPKSVKRFLASMAKRGGRTRAKRLTAARRRAIAKKAARTRWSKTRR